MLPLWQWFTIRALYLFLLTPQINCLALFSTPQTPIFSAGPYFCKQSSPLWHLLWSIAGWFFLSIKHNTGLFKVLWNVITCTVQHPRAPLKEEGGPLPARRAGTYCMVQFPGVCMLILRATDAEFFIVTSMHVLTSMFVLIGTPGSAESHSVLPCSDLKWA